MSFPNSGTSFTIHLTRQATNRSFATNYADEVTPKGHFSSSIYPLRNSGPFWDANGLIFAPKRLPETYVLTKTHCGSRCFPCGPTEYMDTLESFEKACSSGHARLPPKASKKMDVKYPSDRVKKAIHLVRNPFDNIVARFHLDRRHRIKLHGNETQFARSHPDNSTGFQRWCKAIDDYYLAEEKKAFGKTFGSVLESVPCRGEFFKYIQWHNLALETKKKLDVPVLILHYEDYENDLPGVEKSILEFLQLPPEGNVTDVFLTRPDQDSYFSKADREHIRRMSRELSSQGTWRLIERYFEPQGTASIQ